ncbi:hypothetical protein Cgig2_002918 [Carnegiea gigantea]|uniref:DUF8040 domain-containing protein n=1 Tax=Carnegiea gigantea TaxID=171969 RepID=A0A9Q1GJC1_9CARY|nr:hypothetical protein Cgig2_002918 [Carnegiea gigantea]
MSKISCRLRALLSRGHVVDVMPKFFVLMVFMDSIDFILLAKGIGPFENMASFKFRDKDDMKTMDDEENVLCVMLLDNVEDLTSEPPSILRLPRLRCERGGESGGEFIHRIVYQEPETCKEKLRLTPHTFIQLVNLLIDRRSLRDDTKVKVPEQVGMCLFILARGALYRDAKDKFKRGIEQ